MICIYIYNEQDVYTTGMYMSFFSQSNSLGASAQWARLICRNPESAQNLHSMWSSAQCGNLPVHSWFSELQEFPWQRGQAVPSQRSPRCLWPRNKGWSIKIGFCIDQQTQLPRSKISPQGPQPRKVGRDLCRAGNSIDPPQLELLRAQRCRKNNAIDAIICST